MHNANETKARECYSPRRFPGWKLGDAKARFNRVVHLAARGAPQRVKVNGKTAVVVVAADEYARLQAQRPQSLHELLSGGPLARLDFDFEGVPCTVREIEW